MIVHPAVGCIMSGTIPGSGRGVVARCKAWLSKETVALYLKLMDPHGTIVIHRVPSIIVNID